MTEQAKDAFQTWLDNDLVKRHYVETSAAVTVATPAKRTPLIAVSMGDPAGIGPEVILKAAAAYLRLAAIGSALVVIGDLEAMRTTANVSRFASAAALRMAPGRSDEAPALMGSP